MRLFSSNQRFVLQHQTLPRCNLHVLHQSLDTPLSLTKMNIFVTGIQLCKVRHCTTPAPHHHHHHHHHLSLPPCPPQPQHQAPAAAQSPAEVENTASPGVIVVNLCLFNSFQNPVPLSLLYPYHMRDRHVFDPACPWYFLKSLRAPNVRWYNRLLPTTCS
jgi:hypothetical protein